MFTWAVSHMADKEYQKSLKRAREVGNDAVVKLLLERDDVVPDTADRYRWTPLSPAAKVRNKGVVNILLELMDITADTKDTSGLIPLFWAVTGDPDDED